jgi:hypothetical protein
MDIQDFHGAGYVRFRQTQRQDRTAAFNCAAVDRALIHSQVAAKQPAPEPCILKIRIGESVAIQQADIPGGETSGFKRAHGIFSFSRLVIYSNYLFVSHPFSSYLFCGSLVACWFRL